MRRLAAMFLIGWSVLAAGQLSGQFYLEKSRFAPGEPIFLYFEVVNNGPQGENFHSADPYSFCSGYKIKLSNDLDAARSCPPPVLAGSCLSSSAVLPPGKKHVERILLNFDHQVDTPGQYSVDAERHLTHAAGTADYFSPETPKDTLDVQSTLYFEVDSNATQDPQALQTFLAQLRSDDLNKRREAARTLASVAPHSLEDVLLAFADDPELREFAPLAFHRLNTQRSMQGLAKLLNKTEVGSYEHIKSADYLAQSNDSQWFPLLQDIARKHARIADYVDDAAELGGDRMLPTLISLTASPDKEFTRINAVTAMGSTGSRAAVPILLDFLKGSDTGIADRARYALRMLTHRTASNDQPDSPQSEYPQWSQWWAHEASSAPIYKPVQCANFMPLQ